MANAHRKPETDPMRDALVDVLVSYANLIRFCESQGINVSEMKTVIARAREVLAST